VTETVNRPRCCFIVQAHRNPNQLARLVRVLKSSSPSAFVVVAYDNSSGSATVAELDSIGADRLRVTDTKIRRSDYTIIEPYLTSVRQLLDEEVPFDWVFYITGQCYPIRSINTIEFELASQSHDGFLEHFDPHDDASPWGDEGTSRGRLRCIRRFPRSLRTIARPVEAAIRRTDPQYRWVRLDIAEGEPVLYRSTKHVPFDHRIKFVGGNHRHVLNRRAVTALVEEIDNNPGIMRFFKASMHPEESLVQTLLTHRSDLSFVNDYKIYDDYTTQVSGHPRTLDMNDYERMVSSDKFFARKFAVGSPVLDRLDSEIHHL
jgi:hypothetical protein